MSDYTVSKELLQAFSQKATKKGFTLSEHPQAPRLAEYNRDGENVFFLMPDGEIRYKADTPFRSEVMDLVRTFLEMKGAYDIFARATPLPLDGVSNFRLFSEHGNYLMAARMEKDSSLHYVTWQYDYDRQGVTLGHYFGDDYGGAKHDFALRAGFISENKLFTEEELVVLHDACSFRGINDDEISFDDEKKLQSVMGKIAENIPNLLFDRHSQQEHENDNGMEV